MSHLNFETRMIIEHALQKGMSARQIAELTGKHYTSITREILHHRQKQLKGNHTRLLNNCVHRFQCGRTDLCQIQPDKCYHRCDRCRTKSCNEICSNYQLEICPVLQKYPYVCNGCNIIHKCTLSKLFYEASPAQKDYQEQLTYSRAGFNLTREEIDLISTVILEGNRKGQSLYHTLQANKDKLTVPARTVYRLVNESMLRTKRGDMLMSCCRKYRKHPRLTYRLDRKCREGRTYEDFVKFNSEKSDSPVVEIDSVMGKIGGKVILTILFCNCNLMLLYLREHNTAQSVIDIFDCLENELGLERFQKLFPVILTDNGAEFTNPERIENDCNGHRRTKVFYCHSYSAWEKGKIEQNHTLLRRILPPETSFNHLSQDSLFRVANHLNSYIRQSLNGKSPVELFECLYGKELLELLHIEKLKPDSVILAPTLLVDRD